MRAVVEIWLKSLIDDFTLGGLHSALCTVITTFIQTLFSAWMCYVSWTYFGFYPGSRKYSWHCEPVSVKLRHFSFIRLPGWLFFTKYLVARLIIQTTLTPCVSFPLPGGTSSPSLSTCSTHFSLSPGTYMTKVCFERCDIWPFVKEEVQPCVGFARDPP